MGYNTKFEGVLKFKNELTVPHLAFLNAMFEDAIQDLGLLSEDESTPFEYLDLEITDDFSGIKWSGDEKTYYMEEQINFVTSQMKKVFPNFELTGKLEANCPAYNEHWTILMVNGVATKVNKVLTEETVTCPHCLKNFSVKEN